MARLTFKGIVSSAAVLMVGYTILRAAIVWRTLEDYGVNPWIFLAIDIVTVPPYVWGIGKMVQGLRGVNPLRVVYAGGVVAIAAFVAPYGYMYLAGHAAMPMSTKVIVGVIIVALFTAGPIREVIKKVKNGKACSV